MSPTTRQVIEALQALGYIDTESTEAVLEQLDAVFGGE